MINTIYAQVCGVVLDSSTLHPVGQVTVSVQGNGEGTQTGDNGLFILPSLGPGIYTLSFNRIGYFHQNLEITLPLADTMRVYLQENPLEGETIYIADNRLQERRQPELMSRESITAMQIIEMPGALEDPVKVFQNRTGVLGKTTLPANSTSAVGHRRKMPLSLTIYCCIILIVYTY
jgi:hypothetical protein